MELSVTGQRLSRIFGQRGGEIRQLRWVAVRRAGRPLIPGRIGGALVPEFLIGS
jgi:hypothetical protein